MKSTKVLIIGAGPSGMVSALCLAKLGIPSIITERNASTADHPKAHELNTRSVEILAALGIMAEDLETEASPFSDGARILFCNTIKEEFGRIDLYVDEKRRKKYERHLQSKTPYLNISQTALEKIILQKVKDNPLIEILFHHEWKTLKDNGDLIKSEILDRENQSKLNIQSEFVIAADGAGSRCRKFLDIKMEGPEKIQDFASAYFEYNLRDHVQTPAKLYWILNPFAPGVFIAHHIEKRWVYMIPVFLEYQKKEQFTKPFFEDKIKTALADDTLNIEVKSISFWRMSAQLAETYRKDRILLVGDAAHRFPPTGGLGMNTGIADAHNVCWKIAAVLDGKAGLDFLDTYEQERKPIAAQNAEESLYNYHKILEVIEAFGLGRKGFKKLAKFRAVAPTKWLPESWKDRLIHLVNKMAKRQLGKFYKKPSVKEKVRSAIADQIAHFDRIGLDIGYVYEKGAVIPDGTPPVIPGNYITEYIPSSRPGARFPHLDLSSTGTYNSTHDLLSYGSFTLFIREKGEFWKTAHREYVQKSLIDIQLVRLHQLSLDPETYEKLIDLCGIDQEGALLVRPDGHVACRIKSHSSDTDTLPFLFNQLFESGNRKTP